MDFGHVKSSALYELSTVTIGSVLACCLWYAFNFFGYSYGVTPLVVVGATLMFMTIFDNRQFGSNPGTKTCTYELLACLLIFFMVIFYLGQSSFTGGPSAPSSMIGILTASIGMASVIAFARATYFAMILISRFELPSL